MKVLCTRLKEKEEQIEPLNVNPSNGIKSVLKGLKEKVRSSNNILIIGVDIGKRQNCACFTISNGKILNRRYFFPNTAKGFEWTLNKAKFYKNRNLCSNIVWGMEPSGEYWKHLYQFLTLKGYLTVTVSPLAVSRNRETINVSKDKTDPKDAHNITDLVMQGKFYLHSQRDKTVAQISRFMKVYFRTVNAKSAVRNRLRNALGYAFPELERYFYDIEAKTLLAILHKYPLPSMITAIPRHRFFKYVAKQSPHFSHKRIKEIYKMAKESIGIINEDKALLFEIETLLEDLYILNKRILWVNERVHKIVKDRKDYKLLFTIPGIGPITAASIIAEVGDIQNFTSGKQLVKLAGLDLWSKESGDSIHTLKHITKRGRKLLRTIMYQAALRAIRTKGPFRDLYLRILANQPTKKKKKSKALIAVACKLLRVVFRILTDEVPYDKEYDKKLRERQSERPFISLSALCNLNQTVAVRDSVFIH